MAQRWTNLTQLRKGLPRGRASATARLLEDPPEVRPASVPAAIHVRLPNAESIISHEISPKTVRAAFEIKPGMTSQRCAQQQRPYLIRTAEGTRKEEMGSRIPERNAERLSVGASRWGRPHSHSGYLPFPLLSTPPLFSMHDQLSRLVLLWSITRFLPLFSLPSPIFAVLFLIFLFINFPEEHRLV